MSADPFKTLRDRQLEYQAEPVVLVDPATGEAGAIRLSGSIVAESSQTEADATNDVLTFANPITAVEIYHSEETPQDFVINGLTVTIAAGGWRSPVGGTPGVTVGLPNGVTGIIVTPLK